MDNEPLILAFCCHYCAYAAADLAGSMRLQYPGNVRVLRLPCTGKLEVNYLLAAFERGVDGVIVAGCLEGGCHFLEGNLRARRRVERAREFLAEIGLEPERLEMFNLSSAEGPRFAEIVDDDGRAAQAAGPEPACGPTGRAPSVTDRCGKCQASGQWQEMDARAMQPPCTLNPSPRR